MQPTHENYGLQRPPYPHTPIPVPIADHPYAPVVAPAPAADPRTRTAAIALLLSAVAILIAGITKSWFTAHDGGVGLLGLERCRSLLCQSMNWFDVKHAPAQVVMFATVGLVAACVYIAFAMHGTVMLLRGQPRLVKQRFLNGALGIATFGMAGFLCSIAMGDWAHDLSLGWSGILGLGGAIASGIVTSTMIRPLARA